MGGNRIKIRRITDFMTVLDIQANPIIKSEIFEDQAEVTVPDIVNEFWLGAEIGDEIIGCFRIHQITRPCWQGHIMIIPGYRKEYARSAAKLAIKWLYNEIQELRTLICHIPVCHINVIKFVKGLGFEFIGIIPNSYIKNEELMGVSIYALSIRGE